FEVVDEKYTSRACSSCGSLSGPKGVNGLRVRVWTCCECGDSHDRDVNAARNIVRLGSRCGPPCAGTSFSPGVTSAEQAAASAVARHGEKLRRVAA
ncbi:MAG: zinc ribbon domain-containing protein, partial [Steroidobacteraceae bacterium]